MTLSCCPGYPHQLHDLQERELLQDDHLQNQKQNNHNKKLTHVPLQDSKVFLYSCSRVDTEK